MIHFQYYTGGIKSVVPKGIICINRFFDGVKNTKPEMLEMLNKISHASRIGDIDTKNYLKTKLIFFTPAIVCNYRNYEKITNFTGIAPLDFDKLESPEYAIDFKRHLFDEHPEVIACWLSSSKKGVRAFVKIPICNSPNEYREYYDALTQCFGVYEGYDAAPKNAVLPLFLSHDPDLLQRDDATLWTKKYIPPPLPPKVKPILIYDDKKTQAIFNNAIKSLNRITHAGHPILRATAYTMGGYVASGYISESEAEEFFNFQIDMHYYLGADKMKTNTYKKTAKEMILKGKKEPLTL
jgi:hypothetical protein